MDMGGLAMAIGGLKATMEYPKATMGGTKTMCMPCPPQLYRPMDTTRPGILWNGIVDIVVESGWRI